MALQPKNYSGRLFIIAVKHIRGGRKMLITKYTGQDIKGV